MQTQVVGHDQPRMTIPRVARLIYSEGGLIGFYRGIAAPLLSLVVLNTMTFSSYSSFKETLGVSRDTKVFGWKENIRVAAAAAIVGPISALISTPFEMVKTRMQLNMKAGILTNGSIQVETVSRSSLVQAFHLVKAHGVSILYVGHGVNTVREMAFLATYFTVYENMKSSFLPFLSPSFAVPFAGGLSGAMGWFVTFPLDCVKANIQGGQLPRDTSRSAIRVASDLLKARGILGLYAGLMPSIARAFLVSSSRFSAYELTMWLLK